MKTEKKLDKIIGLSKLVCKDINSNIIKTYKLASYEKSDYSNLAKYSVEFNFPEKVKPIYTNLYSPKTLEDLEISDSPSTLDTLEKYSVFTLAKSETPKDSDLEYFGVIKSSVDSKTAAFVLLPPETEVVEVYSDDLALILSKEDKDTRKAETFLVLILDLSGDEGSTVNLALSGFYASGIPFRNKEHQVLMSYEKDSSLPGSPLLTIGERLYHRVSGVLLGTRKLGDSETPIYQEKMGIVLKNQDEWSPVKVYKDGEKAKVGEQTWVSVCSGNYGNRPGLSGFWRLSEWSPTYKEISISASLSHNGGLTSFPASELRLLGLSGKITYSGKQLILNSLNGYIKYSVAGLIFTYPTAQSTYRLLSNSFQYRFEVPTSGGEEPSGVKLIFQLPTCNTQLRFRHATSSLKSFKTFGGSLSDWIIPGCYYEYTNSDGEEVRAYFFTADEDGTVTLTDGNDGYLRNVPLDSQIVINLERKILPTYYYLTSEKLGNATIYMNEEGEPISHYRDTMIATKDAFKTIALELYHNEVVLDVQNSELEVSSMGNYVTYKSDFTVKIFSPSETLPIINIQCAGQVPSYTCQHESVDGPGIYTLTITKIIEPLTVIIK